MIFLILSHAILMLVAIRICRSVSSLKIAGLAPPKLREGAVRPEVGKTLIYRYPFLPSYRLPGKLGLAFYRFLLSSDITFILHFLNIIYGGWFFTSSAVHHHSDHTDFLSCFQSIFGKCLYGTAHPNDK